MIKEQYIHKDSMTYYLATALDILIKASSVPSDMCFFINPLNSPKMPFTLIFHCTSTRVLFVSIGVSTIFFCTYYDSISNLFLN